MYDKACSFSEYEAACSWLLSILRAIHHLEAASLTFNVLRGQALLLFVSLLFKFCFFQRFPLQI